MDDIERIKVSKDTQKFVYDLTELPIEKYHKVVKLLEALEKQQEVETQLESKRGWRYMWQRTPKPYLLMLGYLVFLTPVGSLGYQAFSHVPDNIKVVYLIILALVLLLPLSVVFYLSYSYTEQRKKENTE